MESRTILAVLACLVVAAVGSPDTEVAKGHYAPRSMKTPGDLLSIMEWYQGSDDVSAVETNRPHIFSAKPGSVSPTHLFGILFDKSGKPIITEPSHKADTKKQQSADQLGAALVRAHSRVYDPEDQGAGPVYKQYLDFLKRHKGYVNELGQVFTTLDANGDGYLDSRELQLAVSKGHITVLGARAIKSWDINWSKRTSWQEFLRGPLFLLTLENNAQLLQQFKVGGVGSMDQATKLFRSILTSYEKNTPAAFGLIEEDAKSYRVRSPMSRERARRSREVRNTLREREQRMVMKLARSNPREAALRTLGLQQPAFIERRGRRTGWFFKKKKKKKQKKKKPKKKKKKKGKKKKGKKKKGKKKKIDPRPKSKFGIPSEKDETCVICQYIIQRVEKEMDRRVVDDYTAFDDLRQSHAATGGFPGLDQMLGRTGSIRQNSPRQRLVSLRGSRSPTRMIRQVFETVMKKECGKTAPELFVKGCRTIWTRRTSLSRNIFLKVPGGANCEKVNICNGDTYFDGKNAVHYPRRSRKYNGRRGMCGLMGGLHMRKELKSMKSLCSKKKKKPKKKRKKKKKKKKGLLGHIGGFLKRRL